MRHIITAPVFHIQWKLPRIRFLMAFHPKRRGRGLKRSICMFVLTVGCCEPIMAVIMSPHIPIEVRSRASSIHMYLPIFHSNRDRRATTASSITEHWTGVNGNPSPIHCLPSLTGIDVSSTSFRLTPSLPTIYAFSIALIADRGKARVSSPCRGRSAPMPSSRSFPRLDHGEPLFSL